MEEPSDQSYLVKNLLSQLKQNVVRCGNGTFLQTLAAVHRNSLAGCNIMRE